MMTFEQPPRGKDCRGASAAADGKNRVRQRQNSPLTRRLQHRTAGYKGLVMGRARAGGRNGYAVLVGLHLAAVIGTRHRHNVASYPARPQEAGCRAVVRAADWRWTRVGIMSGRTDPAVMIL
jgi:hypothetical protein